jgi:uncharacterized membrane protein SpoIIM required for sporulation/uncharacterized RDD family membrane protein YckC
MARPAPRAYDTRMANPIQLEQRLEIETPEHVAFTYTIAGIGSRAAAAIVDFICTAGILLVFWMLLALSAKLFRGTPLADRSTQWIFSALIVGNFILQWGWYVLWEGLADGQTPGKRWLGLRVVQEGGHPVTFASSAVRNLVRVIDMQPGISYGVAIVSSIATRNGKRLGDIAGGTIVVQEKAVPLVAGGVPVPAAGTRAPALATLLTDDEFAVLERFVARRGELDAERRGRLVEQLATRFRPRVPDFSGSDAAMLLALHERERAARASGVAARSDTGAAREQYALVARGADRWARFARALDEARARGLRRMSEREVSEFVAEYREITADLARLRTASRGRDVDAVFYVSRLVAGAHNLFYRQQSVPFDTIVRWVAFGIPRELRRSWRPIALAAALFFLPLAGTWTALVRQPELAPRLLPPGMIDRAQTAREREKRGERYLPQEMAKAQGSLLSSFITTNNLKVSFVMFAGGITAGVLTIFMLLNNGVGIGAGFGVFHAEGAIESILDFVAAHGVLELTALCIAGGAGLLLAAAILLPGARTRRDALVDNGRRAGTLIGGTTILLLIAGLIEGNISPLPWPIEAKAFVALLTALFMLLWFTRGRSPSIAV